MFAAYDLLSSNSLILIILDSYISTPIRKWHVARHSPHFSCHSSLLIIFRGLVTLQGLERAGRMVVGNLETHQNNITKSHSSVSSEKLTICETTTSEWLVTFANNHAVIMAIVVASRPLPGWFHVIAPIVNSHSSSSCCLSENQMKTCAVYTSIRNCTFMSSI